jgi:hypothetical protein
MLRGSLFLALLLLPASEIASENVTMTTYFPAPSGVYNQLITTGNTVLAKDTGAVTIGKILTIGRFATDAEANAAAASAGPVQDGSIYYNTAAAGEFRGRIGGVWQRLGDGGVAFGGFYQLGDNNGVNTPGCTGNPAGTTCGCESPNPLTGSCACPAGFTDSALSRTCESNLCAAEWDQDHYCYKP